MKSLNVLNVEDSPDDHFLIIRHLQSAGYEVYTERVETPQAMKVALAEGGWDVIISDYRMPNFSGIEAFEVLRQSGNDIPFIIVSGTIGEETAVKAMLIGVNDYMMKNNLGRMAPAIEREMQEVINRRKKREAEKNLRESDDRLKMALQAAHMGVWEWDLASERIFCSRELYEIIGVDSLDGSVEDFRRFFAPGQFEIVIEAAAYAVENKTNFDVEFQMRRPDGELIWVADRGKTEYDQYGRAERIIGTLTDITSRKKAEEDLKLSEERFRSLTMAISQVVWTADEAGNFTSARSPKHESVLLTDGDVMTEWMNKIHPEDKAGALQTWLQAVKEKRRYIDEYRMLHNDDHTYHYYISRGTPVFEKNGEIREWIGSITDITNRKLAENSLRESEENFRALVQATSQFVWTMDSTGGSSEFPQWWTDLTGQSPDTGRSWGWLDTVHQDDYENVMATWKQAFENITPFETGFRILTVEDEYRHFITRGVPVFDHNGTFRQWIGTFTDITENKAAEEALRKSEAELIQSQKLESVGRLAGGIAHDFNNMLTAINGYSDLTIRKMRHDDPLRANIEEIRKAGERSAELTHQLLAFSRQQILQEVILDLNSVVADTSMMLKRVIGEDIQLIPVLSENIGKIKVDPGQLSQVILNLVVNARDAMPRGGKITIETQNVDLDRTYSMQHISVKPGRYVMMAVSDTGSGIPAEIMEHLFEPFFTTKAMGMGTGLGLSTVYGIVKQSGGNIWVYSEPNDGTTFKIYFPLIEEEVNPLEKIHTSAGDHSGTETILLVEDEEILRKLGREILETSGYRVIEAQNGIEALEICEQHKGTIDLLLTDVVMPQMGGRELAAELTKRYPAIRVLFTSGYTDDAIVRHGIIDHGTNFIQKPFTLEALSRKVRESLDIGYDQN